MSSIPSKDRAIIDRELKVFYGVGSVLLSTDYEGMSDEFLRRLWAVTRIGPNRHIAMAALAELDSRSDPSCELPQLLQDAYQHPYNRGWWRKTKNWFWRRLKWFRTRAERARRLRSERLERFVHEFAGLDATDPAAPTKAPPSAQELEDIYSDKPDRFVPLAANATAEKNPKPSCNLQRDSDALRQAVPGSSMSATQAAMSDQGAAALRGNQLEQAHLKKNISIRPAGGDPLSELEQAFCKSVLREATRGRNDIRQPKDDQWHDPRLWTLDFLHLCITEPGIDSGLKKRLENASFFAIASRVEDALKREQALRMQNVGMQPWPGAAAAKAEFASPGVWRSDDVQAIDRLNRNIADVKDCMSKADRDLGRDFDALNKWASDLKWNIVAKKTELEAAGVDLGAPGGDRCVTQYTEIPFSTNHTPPATGDPVDFEAKTKEYIKKMLSMTPSEQLKEKWRSDFSKMPTLTLTDLLSCTETSHPEFIALVQEEVDRRESSAEPLDWDRVNQDFVDHMKQVEEKRSALVEAAEPKVDKPVYHLPYGTHEALKWRAEIAATPTDVLRSNINTGDITHPEYMKMAQQELAMRDVSQPAIQAPAPAPYVPKIREVPNSEYEMWREKISSMLPAQLAEEVKLGKLLHPKYWNLVQQEQAQRLRLATHGSEPLKTAPEKVDPELLDAAQVEALPDGIGVMLAVGGSEYFYPYVIFTELLSGQKYVRVPNPPASVVLPMLITGRIRSVGKSLNQTRVKIAKP